MQSDEASPPQEDDHRESSLFVDGDTGPFWDNVNVSTAMGPLTDEEKATLRDRLPKRVAEFLIKRAEDATDVRNNTGERSLLKTLDLAPEVPEWDDDDDEYKDYVYDSVGGVPQFRRQGNAFFGGSDGLPDIPDTSNIDANVIDVGEGADKNRVQSLFVGNVNSVDERAAQIGYSVVGLCLFLLLFKIITAVVSFFVSFTFSFLAIFALSAGIFVVFFVLRF